MLTLAKDISDHQFLTPLKHRSEIASAYTWDELMAEPGVDTVTASEIRLWLEERGAALRPSPEGESNWYRSTPTPNIG